MYFTKRLNGPPTFQKHRIPLKIQRSKILVKESSSIPGMPLFPFYAVFSLLYHLANHLPSSRYIRV